jgi:hypothetical protein
MGMTRGKDYTSLDEARGENLGTAKKVISAFEMAEETGQPFGRAFFRTLLLDFANANIRFMEAQDAKIKALEAELSAIKGG